MFPDHRTGLRVLTGLLAAICSITGLVIQLWNISGVWSWTTILFLVSIVCCALLILFDPSTVTCRFAVLKACKHIKEIAGETIDIAAGDCSWLNDELPVIKRKLDNGVRVRLLCRPTQDADHLTAIRELSKYQNADIRRYGPKFELYLRCIIVDRNRPQHAGMLVLDKHLTARAVLGRLSIPRLLRRDHSATVISSHSRLFFLVTEVFNNAFNEGTPKWDCVAPGNSGTQKP